MKRLKISQTFNCTYCKLEGIKTKAIWRNYNFNQTSCEGHKENLKVDEDKLMQVLREDLDGSYKKYLS